MIVKWLRTFILFVLGLTGLMTILFGLAYIGMIHGIFWALVGVIVLASFAWATAFALGGD